MMATFRPPMNGFKAMSWHNPSRIRRWSSPTNAARGMKLFSGGFSTTIKSGCVCAAACTQLSHRLQGASVAKST